MSELDDGHYDDDPMSELDDGHYDDDPMSELDDGHYSDTTDESDDLDVDPITGIQPSFNLDVDGDGQVTPLGDGLMVIRKLFGDTFAGEALTSKAISPDATRDTDQITAYIQSGIDNGLLDIDRDGAITPLGDGLMIIRSLFGDETFAGSALTSKAISPDSFYADDDRPWEAIANNIDDLIPD
jgi:hypothetical protein